MAALAAAILVAAVSFVLLTSAAQTSSLQVRGTVRAAFRPAYDILVRPPGSKTVLERQAGLVRPNYLSGIFGGISMKQYREVQRIAGVDVAAPVANIGYVLPAVNVVLSLDQVLSGDPFQLYRVDTSYLADRGRSRYPTATEYVYFTRRDRMRFDDGPRELFNGREIDPSTPFWQARPPEDGPYASYQRLSVFSARSPGEGTDTGRGTDCWPPGRVTACFTIYFPMLIAAIDPREEARLVHLSRAMVSGRYLRDKEQTHIASGVRQIPVIASDRTYVDEPFVSVVRRLEIPAGAVVPKLLASTEAYSFLSALKGAPVARLTPSVDDTYRKLLVGFNPRVPGLLYSPLYWSVSNVRYQRVAAETLRPKLMKNPISVWATPASGRGYWDAPGSNRDLQFRRLTAHAGSNLQVNGLGSTPDPKVVGQFDPTRLASFSPLSRVPLETYYPPLLEPANAESSAALGGKPLRPTNNIAGYIQQPPLLLTTLQAAKAYYDPQLWSNVRGKGTALISVIRVRVKGVRGPDSLSLERIKVVAQKIHDETGLDVDITAGSSPHPTLIDLPSGRFGRPPLLLREGWSKKGVSVSFLRALDRKDVALFALILVICGFSLGNGAVAAARARRTEIGVLRTFGWKQRAIFTAVLSDLAAVGLIAGAAGVILALGVVVLFGLHLALWRVVLVLPLAIALAVVAGLVPALLASGAAPLDAVRPRVARSGRGRQIRRVIGLAAANLRRAPSRTLLGAAGLFVGVAALTVLVGIEQGFDGTLVGTVLGNAISVQVRGSDFVALGIAVALATFAVADVLYLNVRERSAEFASLRAVGWADRHLGRLVLVEALGLGVLGSVTGAVVGLAIGALLLAVPIGPLLVAAAIASAAGLACVLAASLLPISQVARLTPHSVLAEE